MHLRSDGKGGKAIFVAGLAPGIPFAENKISFRVYEVATGAPIIDCQMAAKQICLRAGEAPDHLA